MLKSLSTERGIINQNVGGLQVSVDKVLLMDVTDSSTAACSAAGREALKLYISR